MKSILLFWVGVFLLVSLFANLVFAEKIGDYDGDGKTDILVRRRNVQNSHLFWFSLNSSNNSFSATQWGHNPGNTSDFPVFGDFDGDGKTDIGVWRTAFTNELFPTVYYILRSSDQTLFALQWGKNDDQEISQDYDGDGICDPAVARTDLNGTTWYVMGSQRGYFSASIRRSGFVIHGDYDGDGKADFGLVRSDSNNNQFFHILKSSTGQVEVTQFGNGFYDYAVPGDYDGDGKTDIAIWGGKNESVSGLWVWLRSSDGTTGTAHLGTGFTLGDHAVPGDYDGDGKTDPAIYRQGQLQTSPSYFHILGSANGYYALPWGLGSDIAPIFWSRVK